MTYYKFANVTQGVNVQKTTQILGNLCLTIEPKNITVSINESKKNINVKEHRKGVEL
jgi:molybdenum cofactor biosynthesis enzyme